MNQDEYLNQLGGALNTLAPEEIMDIQSYYANSIQGQVLNGVSEEQAVQNLGPVDQVAGRILNTRTEQQPPVSRNVTGPRKKRHIGIAIAGVAIAACVAISAAVSSVQSSISGVKMGRQSFTAAAGTVESISIDAGSSDVSFSTSEDDDIHVKWDNNQKTSHTVKQDGSELLLTTQYGDGFDWNWFSDDDDSITVELPDGYQGTELDIKTTSGGIDADDLMVSGNITLTATSGDISGYDMTVPGTLKANSTSGDVYISYSTMGAAELSSTSGYVSMYDSTITGDASFVSTSGGLYLDETTVAGATKVASTSGDIDLSEVAVRGGLDIATTSGEVELSLAGNASDYKVDTTTVSGEIEVPSGADNGACTIHIGTVSGDVNISFSGESAEDIAEGAETAAEEDWTDFDSPEDFDRFGEYIDEQVNQGLASLDDNTENA